MFKAIRKINRTVYLLGITSFLNDLSSDMILAVLPMFIAALGGAGVGIGFIGGIEDSFKSILSVFSGHFSDRIGKRKPFVISGYGISALFKSLLPVSTIWAHVLGFKVLERVGKGVRTAPRDALIADAIGRENRGINFGFHRAMDTAGALLGSLLALLFFWFIGFSPRTIILIGGLLAFTSLVPLFMVGERKQVPMEKSLSVGLARLSTSFKLNLIPMIIFSLANFSYMFFLLKVNTAFTSKLAIGMPLIMYVLYNFSYTFFSVPAGVLSDRLGRRKVLSLGYSLFALTSFGFAFTRTGWLFALLFVLYGIVYAIIEGNQRAFASDLSRRGERGTALGTFHLSIGLAALVSSIIAGILWQMNPRMTFFYGAGMAVCGVASFLMVTKLEERRESN